MDHDPVEDYTFKNFWSTQIDLDRSTKKKEKKKETQLSRLGHRVDMGRIKDMNLIKTHSIKFSKK